MILQTATLLLVLNSSIALAQEKIKGPCNPPEGFAVLHAVCSRSDAAQMVFGLVRTTKVKMLQCSRYNDEISLKWKNAFDSWMKRNKSLIDTAYQINMKNNNAKFDINEYDVGFLIEAYNPSIESCSSGYKNLYHMDYDIKNMNWLQGNLHYLDIEIN